MGGTHSIIVLLLIQHQTELRLIGTWLVKLGLKQYRHPVVQEGIELRWVRVQSFGLEAAGFLIGDLILEADDVSVLDFTLVERAVWFHELDHARFDFLRKGDESARRVGEDVSRSLPRRVSVVFRMSTSSSR